VMVEMEHMYFQVTNRSVLRIGCGMQFIISPFYGFALPAAASITLLVLNYHV
jgi:hypothetical protein